MSSFLSISRENERVEDREDREEEAEETEETEEYEEKEGEEEWQLSILREGEELEVEGDVGAEESEGRKPSVISVGCF